MEQSRIDEARLAALQVLLHNSRGPFEGLPRTAGWGYPEPYTRDLMISALGLLVSRDAELVDALRRTLVALAANQSPRGHIPSLAHDPEDRGASDTTPLFLFGLALYRKHTGQPEFLDDSAKRALLWMQYQSPDDRTMVAQLPTSDWRDEQWVMGYGLYVNTLTYASLVLHGEGEAATQLRFLMNRLEPSARPQALASAGEHSQVGPGPEGLVVPSQPFYALWSYKVFHSDRFDLLGNSLAILTGVASPERARDLVNWVETECEGLRKAGDLVGELPPCLFPYILPGDADWYPRYERYNQPGEYHNGGLWPFVCAFYVAACVAVGRHDLAVQKLHALTDLVSPWHEDKAVWGFNEWSRAQTGRPSGRDWQTWSAAMYLYAAECVRLGETPFFDEIRARRPQ